MKNTLINFAICALSFYFSAVLMSLFIEKLAGLASNNFKAIEIHLESDLKELNLKYADHEKFNRIFAPYSLNTDPNLKILAKKMGTVLIGSFPNDNVYVCEEGYGLLRTKLDRLGFRNRDDTWNNINQIQVLLVGDSNAFGECVPEESNISETLIRGGLYTANVGMGASNPSLYAALTATFLSVIEVDFLVTVFNPRDRSEIKGDIFYENFLKQKKYDNYFIVEDNKINLSPKIKKVINEFKMHLEQKKSEISFYANISFWVHKVLYSRHWGLDGFSPFLDALFERDTLIPDSGTKLAIDTALRYCVKPRCVPLFLYIPNNKNIDKIPISENYQAKLKAYIDKTNGVFVDSSEAIETLGDEAWSPTGHHLSPMGFAEVSKILKDSINGINLN